VRTTNGYGGPVLVVDDDANLRVLITGLLRSAGYRVRSAATARKALAAAQRQRPALVLLDVNLPDLSGYEVCHQLRAEFGNDLPILFISGHRTEDYDRTAGLLLGADDYIAKPFVNGEVVARVRRAIERSTPSPAAPELTEREREVLRLLAMGLGEKSIAEVLVVTPKTVATHIQRILPKLDVHSRAEAVAFAHRHRLFDGH
jgi:DNA-binding NarL/FixJ family response regulator